MNQERSERSWAWMGLTSALRYPVFRIAWERPSRPKATGGRPGAVSSVQKAWKTGQEASGLAAPRSARVLRLRFLGVGMGSFGGLVIGSLERMDALALEI